MSVEEAMARFERMAFAQFLRVRVAQVSHERAVLRLPFQEDNANQGGVLHGGATASLIHMAGTLAAWTGLDLQAELLVNTVALSIQYLAEALREEITAEAMVLRRGRDILFLDVTVCYRRHRSPECPRDHTSAQPEKRAVAPAADASRRTPWLQLVRPSGGVERPLPEPAPDSAYTPPLYGYQPGPEHGRCAAPAHHSHP